MTELRDFLDPGSVAQLERLQVVARKIAEGFLRGLHRRSARGASIDYAEHRPYVPGDDLKHLDWRSYARTDRFYLKQFEDETNLRATLVLDTSASMSFSSGELTKLRYASCLAAAMAYLLLGQRDAVGLALAGESLEQHIPPRASAENLAGIYGAMEKARAEGRTDLSKVLSQLAERVDPGSLTILISDLLDDEQKVLSGISQLRQRGSEVIVLQVLDPCEKELPFNSWMVLRDIEDPSIEMRLDARQLAELYRENFIEHQDAIRKGCSAAEVDYLCLDTSAPFANTLGRFLHLRSRQR